MASRKTTAVTIALFLVLSSSMAIMINNDSNVSGSGINYDENGWIKISTPEQLSQIGGGGTYGADGKYVLTNDIDFTGKDLNGGFDLYVAATLGTNEVTIMLYHPEGDFPLTSASPIIVSFNGEVGSILDGTTAVIFSTDSSFTGVMNITAGGTADLTALEGVSRSDFAIAVTLEFEGASYKESPLLRSNGNMDPIADPFTGTFHGNGHEIIGLETAVFKASEGAYSALFGRVDGATFDDIGLIDGSSVAVSSSSSSLGSLRSSYAGGLVGAGGVITMTNCYNTGDVTALSSLPSSNAGGLIGQGLTIEMTNCYNTGSVTASSSSSYSYAGGLVGRGDISSMTTMTNCYNTGSVTSSSYAGGLVGSSGDISSMTTMTNCYNTGSVTASSYAGGLVGSGGLRMMNCYNTGDVTATSSGSSNAGGLVGSIGNSLMTMTNCYNTGDVTASSPLSSSQSSSNAGGLVGRDDSTMTMTMTNCYNTGDVSATAYNAYAGGLVGRDDSTMTMTNCYNTGKVSSTSSTSSASLLSYAGGLVGLGNNPFLVATITMTNCYNTGDVTATSSGSSNAGGLVGRGILAITMTNCYNTGKVSSTSSANSYTGGLVGYGTTITMMNCYNTGSVSSPSLSSSQAGGLVGRGSTTITMTNCYNTGSVSASVSSSLSSDSYAGGLVGSGSSGSTITMTNCYNTGSVSASVSSSSSLSSDSYAGGLVGSSGSSGSTITMTNCYSIGMISVSGTYVYKGGIIGYGDSTCYITNCYFSNYNDPTLDLFYDVSNAIKDGLPGSNRTSELSGPRSLNDLAKKTTYHVGETEYRPGPGNPPIFFPGWDFDNIWCMDSGVNNGYPFLRSTIIMGQPSNVTADKVEGNMFSVRLGAFEGTAQWQKLTNGQWGNIFGDGLTYTTKTTDAFGDKFRCVVTVGGDVFTSNSASLLEASIDDPGTDDPGTDGPGDGDGNGNGGNGGNDGGDDGDNMMLFIGIGIAAVAAIGVIGYFVFVRKP